MRLLTHLEIESVSGGDDTPNFVIQNGTDADRQKLNAAVSYLRQSSFAAAALDSNDTVNVVIVDTTAKDAYDPQSNTIYWDPNDGITTTDANGNATGYESSALTFFHEYDHSQDPNFYQPINEQHFFPSDTFAQLGFTDMNEVHATQETNAVADQLGQPERATYYGSDVQVAGVSDYNSYNTYYDPNSNTVVDPYQIIGFYDNLDQQDSNGYLSYVNTNQGNTFDYFVSDGGGYDYNQPRS